MAIRVLRDVAARVALQECVDVRSGKTPARNRSDFWTGTVPWFSAKDMKSFRLSDSEEHISITAVSDGAPIATAGDLLILVRGMTLAKDVPVGVLGQDSSFNQDIKSLRPLAGLRSDFLGYMLAASRPHLMSMVDYAGHGTGRLQLDRLLSLPIWKPPTQAQISIEAVMGAINRLVGQLALLVQAKQRVLSALRQEFVNRSGRARGCGALHWEVVPLGELVRYTPRKVVKPSTPFLSAGVRSHGRGVFLKRDFAPSDIALEELFALKYDDLVVNITFGWEGAIAIVPREADGALVSHRFPTYEVNQRRVLVQYLRHVIRAKRFVFDVGVASPGGAGRNRVLNRREFLEIPIGLPSVHEQERVTRLLNSCEREIELLERKRDQFIAYKKWLLSRLLTGEIPVAL